ncbi:MFS family permease [Bradyrhizobium sp. USDA 4369]
MTSEAQVNNDAEGLLRLWAHVLTISLLVGVFAIAVGGTPVLLSVSMARSGWSDAAIGLSAASSPLGIVVASLFAPTIAERAGAVLIAVSSCVLGLLASVLMATSSDFVVWTCARVLWGFSVGTFYILNKVWLSQIVHMIIRGRVFGIYNSLLSAGFSIGPLVVSLVDFNVRTGLSIFGFTFLFCALGVLMSRRWLPKFEPGATASSALSILPILPVALLCGGVFGAFDHMTLSFLPTLGPTYGQSLAAMSVGLSVLNAGNILLQTPIGWASDYFGRRAILVVCALSAAAGAVLLPLFITSTFLYVFLFFWGSLAYGVVTISLAAIGDRFAGSDLLRANALMTMTVGVGGVIGPSLAGVLVSFASLNGLSGLIAAMYSALAILALRFNIMNARR